MVFTSPEPVGDYLEKVLTVENTLMQDPPFVTQYPAYDGDGMITVNRTTVVDPDGILVEINQIFDGLDLDSSGYWKYCIIYYISKIKQIFPKFPILSKPVYHLLILWCGLKSTKMIRSTLFGLVHYPNNKDTID